MDLLRAAAFATLVTAWACLLPRGLAAEDLTAAIVVESDQPGGYMRLGGGLAHAMVKRRAGNAQKVQVKDLEQARRAALRSQRSLHPGSTPRRATDDGPPIKFIAQTLDPSGQNIIGLTYSPPPPVD